MNRFANEYQKTIASADKTLRPLDGIAQREVGPLVADVRAAVAQVTAVGKNADVMVAQTQRQLQRVVDGVLDGMGDIGDLAAMLKADPSSLVQGRTWPKREPQ